MSPIDTSSSVGQVPTPQPQILVAHDVHVVYRGSRAGAGEHAVRGVSLALHEGETLGIVGESGSGKSSLARAMAGLEPIARGRVTYRGTDLPLDTHLSRDVRLDLQMVFQDPASALNPRRRIGAALADALGVRGRRPSAADVERLLDDVGLPADFAGRYPAQASGGQLQRVVIARALAAEPTVLLADEPVSALDVSVQAQVLDLLVELRERHGLSMVFVSHDLGVVRHVSDRIAVMRRGEVVEVGLADDVVDHPQHPYTRELLAAVPDPDAYAAG
ncbi:ABC transporter ATP-binding protein [Cellulomonas citrea]|uniref:ABC transporter ATP-binding protein n=1 Tax=Cellulomonas citrea TaxID=1909423 RepID=UPI001359E74D|nr:ATP-binding cassette domain-containing protein [Cellulomonas citrea]